MSTQTLPSSDVKSRANPAMIANWLYSVAFLVFIMVIVGGITRLTESGLSITEWKPVTGALPPLNEAQWLSEFEKYKQIPEYLEINGPAGMTMAEAFTYWIANGQTGFFPPKNTKAKPAGRQGGFDRWGKWQGVPGDLKPEDYTNPQAPAIAQAAARLNALRENWLNPPEWVERVPEVVPGYPDRILPKPGHAADLKQRTLTNLYNQRPAWLAAAHQALDAAVAAAYGWPADLDDAELLRRLLALNWERSSNAG
jgi:hypothetical protein